MNLWQAILEALESIRSNKMRSTLTILGIVIGVGAVIAMLAVGAGAQSTITGSISGIGSNLLFVYSGNSTVDVTNPKVITTDDAAAMLDQSQAPDVLAVAPEIQGSLKVSAGKESENATVSGVTVDYATVRNSTLSEGSFFSDQDILGRTSVAIIGNSIAKKLFDRTDGIVGETIRISGQPFEVIGVLESKGGSPFTSQDNTVLVPLTTAQVRLMSRGSDEVDVVYVQAISADSVSAASDEISQILRTRHRTKVGLDDFTVYSQEDFVSTAKSITNVFTIFLGGIAGISLLVGGIGIMNIMLVSVTERTREIGLRKALGARKNDIMLQFLTESSMLSLLGGVIGIGLGWLLAFLIGKIATALGSPLQPEVGLNAILLATLFSTAVGLFFGIYPANQAAKLEPVEALRHD